MWKNLRKSLEPPLKIPQDYLESSSIPPKSPFRCPSKATSITSKMIQNYVKLSREPPEMIPITPSFLPCPDPIKPAHDPLEALKTEDKNAPHPHAQARII